VTTAPALPASIGDASLALRSREVTSRELTEIVLDRIARIDKHLNSYGFVSADRAVAEATALDQMLSAGVDLGPLHGIPMAVKDCIDTSSMPTTAGSVIEAGRVPQSDATVVRLLRNAGAVVIGKTNLYEFAYGGPSTLWGEVGNPWNLEMTAGASSNGSAAAVAAQLAYGALGTDMGGSIRIPAAVCGVFGLKPTFGRVSRFGVTPRGCTLDHVGPLTRTAEDAARVLHVIAGVDRHDGSTSSSTGVQRFYGAGRPVDGLRIGVPRRQSAEVLTEEVEDALNDAMEIFRALGCSIVECALPNLEHARTLMWLISAAELASFHHEHLRDKRDLLHADVRSLLGFGQFIPATDYVHCQRVRALFARNMSDIFSSIDAILMPMLPIPPWPSSQTTFEIGDRTEDKMTLITRYSPLFNLTGHPAASLLAGFTADDRPLSVQIAAPLNAESTIFALASRFEQETGHFRRLPPIDRMQVTGEA
jgi:aspartyl-tRNA(Asn)/glutamyl-tRNA(Gln) amidotransferase subunit A